MIFKMTKEISFTDFCSVRCCDECDWHPTNQSPRVSVCPKCGSQNFTEKVGKLKIETESNLFVSATKVIGFVGRVAPKESAQNIRGCTCSATSQHTKA